jgi:hypothetical protein
MKFDEYLNKCDDNIAYDLFLIESFKSGLTSNNTKEESDYTRSFIVNGRYYKFFFYDDGAWWISNYQIEDGDSKITKPLLRTTPDAHDTWEVLNNVIECIVKFLKKYNHPNKIVFYTTDKYLSELYTKMFNILIKRYPLNLYKEYKGKVKLFNDPPGNIKFAFIKKES